jgi:hypothetical protein
MAILVVAEATGMTAEQDAAMTKALAGDTAPPPGGIFRLSGPVAGGRRVVTLWENEADFERFRDQKLVPALIDAGREVPAFEMWPIDMVLIRPIPDGSRVLPGSLQAQRG